MPRHRLNHIKPHGPRNDCVLRTMRLFCSLSTAAVHNPCLLPVHRKWFGSSLRTYDSSTIRTNINDSNMSWRHITSNGLSQMDVLCTFPVFWSETAVTACQTHFTLQHHMQPFSGSSIAHHCTPQESHMTNQSMPPSHSVVRFMMLLMNQPLFGVTHQLIHSCATQPTRYKWFLHGTSDCRIVRQSGRRPFSRTSTSNPSRLKLVANHNDECNLPI